MLKFWFVIYNVILLPLLWLAFRGFSIFNSKARAGFRGRRHIPGEIKNWKFNPDSKRVIIHSSSLGEFQQSIPLIDELVKRNYSVVSTFFSPSGFNNSKLPYPSVKKSYLPFDSIPRVTVFLDTIKPDLIILMRYDLWFNFLYAAKKRNIRLIIANARFNEKDVFWKLPVIRSFKKTMYGMIDKMFTIDEADQQNYTEIMEEFGTEIIKTGDSKFERVYEASKTFNIQEVLDKKIYENKKVFIMGSSWKEDEEIILPVIDRISEYEPELLTILVPHEPKETKIKLIERNTEEKYLNLKSIRYSDIGNYNGENFIIIDCIGKLASLYSIGYVAYVGGGFKSGLHNVLEPAIFNLPVLFSNEVKNSDEDEILLKNGCGILVQNRNGFYRDFRRLLSDRAWRDETGSKCRLVFESTLGTSQKIIQNILDK